MPTVVADASVAVQWFRDADETDPEAARLLVEAYAAGRIQLLVLDLTKYEVGNALLRGRARASPATVAEVVAALDEICPAVTPLAADLRLTVQLAAQHGLTVYDAAYAAVAQGRGGVLATHDQQLLGAGVGLTPRAILRDLDEDANP